MELRLPPCDAGCGGGLCSCYTLVTPEEILGRELYGLINGDHEWVTAAGRLHSVDRNAYTGGGVKNPSRGAMLAKSSPTIQHDGILQRPSAAQPVFLSPVGSRGRLLSPDFFTSSPCYDASPFISWSTASSAESLDEYGLPVLGPEYGVVSGESAELHSPTCCMSTSSSSVDEMLLVGPLHGADTDDRDGSPASSRKSAQDAAAPVACTSTTPCAGRYEGATVLPNCLPEDFAGAGGDKLLSEPDSFTSSECNAGTSSSTSSSSEAIASPEVDLPVLGPEFGVTSDDSTDGFEFDEILSSLDGALFSPSRAPRARWTGPLPQNTNKTLLPLQPRCRKNWDSFQCADHRAFSLGSRSSSSNSPMVT